MDQEEDGPQDTNYLLPITTKCAPQDLEQHPHNTRLQPAVCSELCSNGDPSSAARKVLHLQGFAGVKKHKEEEWSTQKHSAPASSCKGSISKSTTIILKLLTPKKNLKKSQSIKHFEPFTSESFQASEKKAKKSRC